MAGVYDNDEIDWHFELPDFDPFSLDVSSVSISSCSDDVVDKGVVDKHVSKGACVEIGCVEVVGDHQFASSPEPAHSRKRKHVSNYVPRQQRQRTTHSYQFQTIEHEVHYRLYKENCLQRSQKLNSLVRTCFRQFGDSWVTWNEIKEVAVQVGYSRRNSLFRSMWPLVTSQYGRHSEGTQNCEVLGLNFPYWEADKSQKLKRTQIGLTKMRLAREFFLYPAPNAPVSVPGVTTLTTLENQDHSDASMLLSHERANLFDLADVALANNCTLTNLIFGYCEV